MNTAQQQNTKPRLAKAIPLIIAAITIPLLAAIILSIIFIFIPASSYNKALQLIDSGNYAEAYDLLCKNPNYKDTQDILRHFTVYFEDVTVESTNYDSNGVISSSLYRRTVTKYAPDGSTIFYEMYNQDGQKVEFAEFEHDENSNAIRINLYNGTGTLLSTIEKGYDDNGNLILTRSLDRNGAENTRHEYEFDENGNETLHAQYIRGKLDFKIVSQYDENNNLILYIRYGQYNKIQEKYDAEYDDDGNRIRQRIYDENDKVQYIYEFSYDQDGNRIEFLNKYYQASQNKEFLQDKCVYEYDAHGNQTLFARYSSSGSLQSKITHEYKYDSNGNMTLSIEYDNAGSITEKVEWQYYENGMVKSKKTEYPQEDSSYKLEEFDQYGNCTLYATYYSGKISSESKTTYRNPYVCYDPDLSDSE